MTIPKAVADIIATLRQERQPVAARLDAIDLAIDNLSRVYGVHGDQPVLIERRRAPKPKAPSDKAERVSANPAAKERRELLLSLIAKSDRGVTMAELRKATPKMALSDRSNAITALRVKGQIRREGNAWMKAA